MNLYEHEAKSVLRRFGLPAPEGAVCAEAAEAGRAAEKLGGARFAVKAQIRAGARAEAGGVRFAGGPKEAEDAARALLGARLATGQTTREGFMVGHVLVEPAQDIARELYAAAMIDRASGRLNAVLSGAGGTGVEDALKDPANLVRIEAELDPPPGPEAFTAAAGRLGLEGAAAGALPELMAGLCRAFVENDALLIEINPLAVTAAGALSVIGAKMVIDDNALFRRPEFAALRGGGAEADPQEIEAHGHELNYVKLDGSVGVMCTGAGMALAAIDLIREKGGEAANFMDIRPVASRAQVAEGVRLLLRNPNVKSIIVIAMGGGILRCDVIAEGVAEACRGSGARVPVVFRAAGTAKEIGELALRNQAAPVTVADSLGEAVEAAVRLAAGGAP